MIIRHKLVKDKNCVLGVGVVVCPKGPFLLVGETMEYIDRRLAKIEAQAQEIERLKELLQSCYEEGCFGTGKIKKKTVMALMKVVNVNF